MGCDIHCHVEVKIDGRWEHYSEVYPDQSYDLFSKMANVRSLERPSIMPISDPRGIPKDINIVTRLCYDDDGEDAHSASWLSVSELVDLRNWACQSYALNLPNDGRDWLDEQFGTVFGGCTITDYIERRYFFPPNLQDIRLVFWFDN